MIKIRICTPFYSEFETVKPGVVSCIQSQIAEFHFEPRQSGPLMFRNRNSLINDLKSQKKYQLPLSGFDYFLFVDSDISFSVKNVERLLSHNKEICCSPYFTHDKPYTYNTGMFFDSYPGLIRYQHTKHSSGLSEVDFSGTGFMLIHRSVFEKLSYPWFEPMKIEFGDNCEAIGEDLCFCIKAKNAGYKIFCDFDNKVDHRKRDVENFNWDIYNCKQPLKGELI